MGFHDHAGHTPEGSLGSGSCKTRPETIVLGPCRQPQHAGWVFARSGALHLKLECRI